MWEDASNTGSEMDVIIATRDCSDFNTEKGARTE
jgi:hypothetical protein